MAVAVFDSAQFIKTYPEFAGFTCDVLQVGFDTATLFCNNTDQSVVQDVSIRARLLGMLTAHIVKITYGTNDGEGAVAPPSQLVGRLEMAKMGTVDGRTDMGPPSGSLAWYNQTTYGAMYAAATAKYRTMRYASSPKGLQVMGPVGVTPAIWPWGRY